MNENRPDRSRRRFLHGAMAGAIAAPIAGLLGQRAASAADKPKLDPSSGQAKALKYVHDAAKASDNPAFQDFVAWLRRRLDEEAQTLDDAAFARMAARFRDTVVKERAFHDAVMAR